MSDKSMVVRDLAASIYVSLLAGCVAVSSTGVKMSTEPRNLAKLSFKLAEAFQATEAELDAPAQSRGQAKLTDVDIAKWMS